jgi:hypothetical protein
MKTAVLHTLGIEFAVACKTTQPSPGIGHGHKRMIWTRSGGQAHTGGYLAINAPATGRVPSIGHVADRPTRISHEGRSSTRKIRTDLNLSKLAARYCSLLGSFAPRLRTTGTGGFLPVRFRPHSLANGRGRPVTIWQHPTFGAISYIRNDEFSCFDYLALEELGFIRPVKQFQRSEFYGGIQAQRPKGTEGYANYI